MSPYLLAAMIALDAGATITFLLDHNYPWAVIFACATIANTATFWLI